MVILSRFVAVRLANPKSIAIADETLGRRFAKAEFGAAGRLLPGRVSEGNL